MEPITYNQGISVRYNRLNEIDSPLEAGIDISKIFQSDLARKLMKETYREIVRIRGRYRTN